MATVWQCYGRRLAPSSSIPETRQCLDGLNLQSHGHEQMKDGFVNAYTIYEKCRDFVKASSTNSYARWYMHSCSSKYRPKPHTSPPHQPLSAQPLSSPLLIPKPDNLHYTQSQRADHHRVTRRHRYSSRACSVAAPFAAATLDLASVEMRDCGRCATE